MIDDVRFLNPIYNSFALDFSTYWENATLMFVGNQSTVSIAGHSHTCDMVLMKNVVCSLICLCTQYAYTANNMNPDQTAPLNNMNPDQIAPLGAVLSGFMVFASMLKVSLSIFEYLLQM